MKLKENEIAFFEDMVKFYKGLISYTPFVSSYTSYGVTPKKAIKIMDLAKIESEK